MQFDNQDRQVKLKIVYYGPAVGGKTTCLQHIHRLADPERRSRLYSLNTASDRTLFFDLMSLELGRIRGYRLTVQLYTVPGQVQYAATRRAVLAGADGVVLVADSQPGQRDANRVALEDLQSNLRANGIDPAGVPLVLQYNKRDLVPVLDIAELEADLNPLRHPSFPSVATTGAGVAEAFVAITERTLEAVAETLGVTQPAALERLRAQARAGLAPVLAAAEQEDERVVRAHATPAAGAPLDSDELVAQAVHANVATSALTAELDVVRGRLQRRSAALAEAARFAHQLTATRAPRELPGLLAAHGARLLRGAAATVLLGDAARLEPVALHGLAADPLLAAGSDLAPALSGARLVAPGAAEGDGPASELLAAVESGGFSSAVLAPLAAGGQHLGLLVVYGAGSGAALDDDALRLGELLASLAAMAWASAEAWSQLEASRSGLEREVTARTHELAVRNARLEQAMGELRAQEELQQTLLERVAAAVRAPTAAVLTATRVLAAQAEAPPERRARFLKVILEEAGRLGEQVEGLAQAALLGRTSGAAASQPVEVEELLRRVLAGVRDAAAARSVELHVLTTPGLTTAWGDPEALVAALRAVIKNAVEFSPSGGQVTVEVRRVQQDGTPWLMVRVRDAGCGIDADERERLVEPLFRGRRQPEGRPATLGLGLTVAARLLALHDGTLRFEAREGGGTEVVLGVPQPG